MAEEFRCPHCDRLIARGRLYAGYVAIRCPRCHTVVDLAPELEAGPLRLITGSLDASGEPIPDPISPGAEPEEELAAVAARDAPGGSPNDHSADPNARSNYPNDSSRPVPFSPAPSRFL